MLFNDETALLDSASLVSMADLRALSKKLRMSVLVTSDDFILLLKHFVNLAYIFQNTHHFLSV